MEKLLTSSRKKCTPFKIGTVTVLPFGQKGPRDVPDLLSNMDLFNQIQRFWYQGPMFRYERPQKGRYRQFEQLGVECFGILTPDIDAEIILLNARLFRLLGLSSDTTLELNSLVMAKAEKFQI